MAFEMRCAGTTENAVGYDTRVSAVYIPVQRRSQALVQGGHSQPGTIQEGLGGKEVFSGIPECGLSENLRGESGFQQDL